MEALSAIQALLADNANAGSPIKIDLDPMTLEVALKALESDAVKPEFKRGAGETTQQEYIEQFRREAQRLQNTGARTDILCRVLFYQELANILP